MHKTFSALLLSTLFLTGCATVRDSRANPLNWFGGARSEPITRSDAQSNPLIPETSGIFSRKRKNDAVYNGHPIDRITDLTIERVPGGVLLRATGQAARQGLYDVQLVPQNKDERPVDGVLIYRLEGVDPERTTTIGPDATRQVIAARTLTDQQLAEVHTIRIEGQRNALASRR